MEENQPKSQPAKSKKFLFKPATVLKKKELQIEACIETIRNRLRENNLKACSP